MNEVGLFVVVAGALVTLIVLVWRARLGEALAMVVVLLVVAGTIHFARPTIISSGTQCPGLFGGEVVYGAEARHLPARMSADGLECNRLADLAGDQARWVWLVGVPGAIVLLTFSRVRRRLAERNSP